MPSLIVYRKITKPTTQKERKRERPQTDRSRPLLNNIVLGILLLLSYIQFLNTIVFLQKALRMEEQEQLVVIVKVDAGGDGIDLLQNLYRQIIDQHGVGSGLCLCEHHE